MIEKKDLDVLEEMGIDKAASLEELEQLVSNKEYSYILLDITRRIDSTFNDEAISRFLVKQVIVDWKYNKELPDNPYDIMELYLDNMEKFYEKVKSLNSLTNLLLREEVNKELERREGVSKAINSKYKKDNYTQIIKFTKSLTKDSYNGKEVGDLLGKTKKTIYSWMDNGDVAITMSGSRRKISKEELVKLFMKKILKVSDV